ncbi:MAG: response regulator [Myxococcales bacterium]|nr:response regulator [Myxococcales bacterium]
MSARVAVIVEDEQIVAMDLAAALEDSGFTVRGLASSADEALELIDPTVDLVLLDVRIRGRLDGIETATAIRARCGAAIVFLTAHADDETLRRAREVGPEGYLVKPVKPLELRSTVEMALHKAESERRLRKREHWFATTLHSLGDAVLAVDGAGRVSFMNARAEALTGWSLGDASALSHAATLLDEVSPELAQALARVLSQTEGVMALESQLQARQSGTRHFVSTTVTPVESEGVLLGAVMVLRDVTEAHRVRQQLEVADRLASLGTMAAGVAHEINNPLSVVVSNAALLQEDLEALGHAAPGGALAPMREMLADLSSAAQRIARIVSDLRAFSRPVALPSRVAQVARAVDWALRTTAHEFRNRAWVEAEVDPALMVQGDELRLGQVLINLLVNAAQAIEPGDVDRHRVRIAAARQGDAVELVVSDTGPGIAPEQLAHLFEPFFTTKPVGLGTGLGLSICHGIVQAMGGTIVAESAPGRGATFRVRLPSAAASGPSLEAPSAAASTGLSVLVIDDEPAVGRAISRILRGHAVTATQSAFDALERLRHGQRFDVILSDLAMPLMTGHDFYEALADIDVGLQSRVIFVSGGAISSRLASFLASVTNRRIEKPFTASTLTAAIGELTCAPSLAGPS